MTDQRGARIVGAIGAVVWGAAAIWTALLPLEIGWKALWVAFALLGCLNWAFIAAGRPGLLSRIGSPVQSRRRDPPSTSDPPSPR